MYYDIRLLMYSATYNIIMCMSGRAAHILYLAAYMMYSAARNIILHNYIYIMYLAAHINMYPAIMCLAAIGGSYYLPMHVFGCSYYVLKILIYDAAP